MQELQPMSISKTARDYCPLYRAQIVSTGTLFFILLHFSATAPIIVPVLGVYTIFGGTLIYKIMQEDNNKNELILPLNSQENQ